MNDLRPEWRGLMLWGLRWFVRPLASGMTPCPIITITNLEMKIRLLEIAPDIESSLKNGSSISAVALLDAMFAKETAKVPLQQTIEFYQGLERLRAVRPKQSFTYKDVLELVKQSEYLLGGAVFHRHWVSTFSCLADNSNSSEEREFQSLFQWYIAVLIVAFYRWGIPFPTILYIARMGPDAVATDALFRAITVEKEVMRLPWVLQRMQEAKEQNDHVFMRHIKQAAARLSVPKELRGRALDFFLCVFNTWLKGLSLVEQAALIREAGMAVSEKALRNRRNRLGLPAIDQETGEEIPPEILKLIEQAQARWEKPPKQFGSQSH